MLNKNYMLDRLSVPRRALDFEDYIDILRRNVRWIIGPAFAGIVISTVVAFLMEDTYVSQAMIRVVPQQISGDIVHSISSQDVTDRIQGLAQQILSRRTHEFFDQQLWSVQRRSEARADGRRAHQNERGDQDRPCRRAEQHSSGRNIPAMPMQFSYHDRIMANKVCADMVSRFMSASSQEALTERYLPTHS